MKQYHAIGSEKANGYSRDAFIGLTPQEKEEVFRLLVTELSWFVEWLFFLDAERALPVVKEAEQKGRDAPYGGTYKLQEAIVNHTKDLTYQANMIEDYLAYHKQEAVGRRCDQQDSGERNHDRFLQEAYPDRNKRGCRRGGEHVLPRLPERREREVARLGVV